MFYIISLFFIKNIYDKNKSFKRMGLYVFWYKNIIFILLGFFFKYDNVMFVKNMNMNNNIDMN